MPDLTTTYLGLQLKNPLVASASPLSKKMDTVRRIEDAGAAALVMYSYSRSRLLTIAKNWIITWSAAHIRLPNPLATSRT